MRNNTNITQLPEAKDKIKIKALYKFDIQDYNLDNEKDLRKYFTDIERLCRMSFSYKRLIQFLREYVDLNACSFFKNINNIDTRSIKIHIHHAPLTLYDIVVAIYRKRLMNKQPLNINLVAKEVMWVHYRLLVGLIPLSETVHEIVHNGFLFIPTNVVFGNYKQFIQEYGQYLEPSTIDTLKKAEEYTQTYDYIKETKVLSMNMVYIDPSGQYTFPKFQELAQALQTHIHEFDTKILEVQVDNEKEHSSS